MWDISDPFPGQHHQGTEDDENGYRPRELVIIHTVQYLRILLRQNPIRTTIVTVAIT